MAAEEYRRVIAEPEITGNARLVLGYAVGRLYGGIYKPGELSIETNSVELEHDRNGNRYRLTIVQISGVE